MKTFEILRCKFDGLLLANVQKYDIERGRLMLRTAQKFAHAIFVENRTGNFSLGEETQENLKLRQVGAIPSAA